MCLIMIDKNKLNEALKLHNVTLVFKDDKILFKSENKLTGIIYLDLNSDKILLVENGKSLIKAKLMGDVDGITQTDKKQN